MIAFRVRQYGSSAWTKVTVASDDEEGDLESELAQSIRSVLRCDDLHTQELSDEGDWEDVE